MSNNRLPNSRLAQWPPSYYAPRICEVTRVAEILGSGEALERALALLRAGDVVAIPTETVYG
ncbi:MAG: translation factor Sua5, partial [Mesorhizobium sp.]